MLTHAAALILGFGGAPPPARAAAEVMQVHYGLVVLQRGLEGVRLRGAATLTRLPNHGDDSTLARRGLDQRSLPAGLRGLRGRSLAVLRRDGSICSARIGALAAYGWNFSASAGAEGVPAREVARRAFAEGSQFIAAELRDQDCASGAVWAMFAAPTAAPFLPVKPAPERLRAAALAEARRLPAYATWQGGYEAFRREQAADRAALLATKKPQRITEPLPAQWIDLDGETQVWTVNDEAGGTLVVAYLRRRPRPIQVESSPPGKALPSDFIGSLVAVWRVAGGPPEAWTPLGPADGGGSHLDFVLDGAARDAAGAVELLYTSDRGAGRLSPVGGRYLLDPQQELRPEAKRGGGS
jgi:hypothetical protein